MNTELSNEAITGVQIARILQQLGMWLGQSESRIKTIWFLKNRKKIAASLLFLVS